MAELCATGSRDRLEVDLHAEGLFFPDFDRRVKTTELADTVRAGRSTWTGPRGMTRSRSTCQPRSASNGALLTQLGHIPPRKTFSQNSCARPEAPQSLVVGPDQERKDTEEWQGQHDRSGSPSGENKWLPSGDIWHRVLKIATLGSRSLRHREPERSPGGRRTARAEEGR